jgi:hypothetical protein
MTPLYRYTPYLLLTILCANIVLYFWFAARTREASGDEIIRKAYVISRLLSDSAGRAIENKDTKALNSVVAEAVKDRHIVSITILDNNKNVLLESNDTGKFDRLSTFNTPIRLGNNKQGTIVTRFSTKEDDERITSALKKTAALQIVLYLSICAVIALFFIKERRSRKAATTTVSEINIPANVPPATITPPLRPLLPETIAKPHSSPKEKPSMVLPEFNATLIAAGVFAPIIPFAGRAGFQFSPPSIEQKAGSQSPQIQTHPQPPPMVALRAQPAETVIEKIEADHAPIDPALPSTELLAACLSLGEAAKLLSMKENDHQMTKREIDNYSERIREWQDEATKNRERSKLLIENTREVVNIFKKESSLISEANRELPITIGSINQQLKHANLVLKNADSVINEISAALSAAYGDHRTERKSSAVAKMLHDGADMMQNLALPAFAATMKTEGKVAERLSILLDQIEEFSERSLALEETSSEIAGLANAIRNPGEEREIIAGRLEAIAALLKRDTHSLVFAAGEAGAVAGATLSDSIAATDMLTRTTAAVEDASQATMAGRDFLNSLPNNPEYANQTEYTARTLTSLSEMIDGARTQLGDQVDAMASLATGQQLREMDYGHSMEMALNSLTIAANLLSDIGAAPPDLPAENRYPSIRNSANLTAEQLVRDACASLLKIIANHQR